MPIAQVHPVARYALAINGQGVIAGFLADGVFGEGERVAVLWTPTSGGWRIDSLGPDEAISLNDIGVVVGELSEPGQAAWFWTKVGGRSSLGPRAAFGINNLNEVIGRDEHFRAVLWTLTPPWPPLDFYRGAWESFLWKRDPRVRERRLGRG